MIPSVGLSASESISGSPISRWRGLIRKVIAVFRHLGLPGCGKETRERRGKWDEAVLFKNKFASLSMSVERGHFEPLQRVWDVRHGFWLRTVWRKWVFCGYGLCLPQPWAHGGGDGLTRRRTVTLYLPDFDDSPTHSHIDLSVILTRAPPWLKMLASSHSPACKRIHTHTHKVPHWIATVGLHQNTWTLLFSSPIHLLSVSSFQRKCQRFVITVCVKLYSGRFFYPFFPFSLQFFLSPLAFSSPTRLEDTEKKKDSETG